MLCIHDRTALFQLFLWADITAAAAAAAAAAVLLVIVQLHRPLQGVNAVIQLKASSASVRFVRVRVLTQGSLSACRYEDASSHLCAAAAAGDMRQLTRLIDNGVDPDVRDYDQRTAFHIAARRGCLKVVDYLVQCKAQINAVDRYCFATRHGMSLAISLKLQSIHSFI